MLSAMKSILDLPCYITGVGMGIWVLAAVGSGLSQDFWSLLIARMFVGAGKTLDLFPAVR